MSHELQDGKQELHRHDKSHRNINTTSRVLRVRDVQKLTGLSVNKNQTSNQSSVPSVGFGRGKTQKAPEGASSVLLNRLKDRATVAMTAKHPVLSCGGEQASLLGGTVVPLEVVTVVQVDQHNRNKQTVSLPKPKELHPTLLQQQE